jgi:AcrR family transcriptional regulator
MGKEKTKLSSSARDRVLETAMKLFYKHGIHTVGIDRIIAEAGVAKMSFYNHFSSKQELILEFLKERDRRFMNWFIEAVEKREARPEKRIFAVFDVLEDWFHSEDFRGCAFINTTAEVGKREAPEIAISILHKRNFRNYLEKLALEAGLKNPDKLAERMTMVIDGAIIKAQMENSSKSASLAKDIFLSLQDSSY